MTRHALHVGASLPFVRGGWPRFGPLSAARRDAADLAELSLARGFETNLLTGALATYGNVTGALRTCCSSLRPGETFLFTFAGHGWQVRATLGDESDHSDEVLILRDRPLVDNELWSLFQLAPAGSLIVFIADACHATTAATDATTEVTTSLEEMVTIVHRVRQPPATPTGGAIATVMTLAATASDRYDTCDTDDRGVFTECLIRAWSELHVSTPSWAAVMERAALLMAKSPVPAVYRQGPHVTLYAGDEHALEWPAFAHAGSSE